MRNHFEPHWTVSQPTVLHNQQLMVLQSCQKAVIPSRAALKTPLEDESHGGCDLNKCENPRKVGPQVRSVVSYLLSMGKTLGLIVITIKQNKQNKTTTQKTANKQKQTDKQTYSRIFTKQKEMLPWNLAVWTQLMIMMLARVSRGSRWPTRREEHRGVKIQKPHSRVQENKLKFDQPNTNNLYCNQWMIHTECLGNSPQSNFHSSLQQVQKEWKTVWQKWNSASVGVFTFISDHSPTVTHSLGQHAWLIRRIVSGQY